MNILTYLLLMSLIQVVLYGYYLLFLRNETWFRFNRAFLLGSLALSFLLPLTKWTFLPGVSLPSVHEVLSFTLEPILITAQGQAAASPISWGPIIWNLYMTGAFASLGLLAFRLDGVLTYIRKSEPVEHTPFYTLYHTHGQLPTSSFFRYIFWDNTQDLSEAERRQILNHECAHIQQGHSWDLLFLELVQIGLWFHPMVYLIRQELVKVHEFHADQKATRNFSKSSYAQLILKEVMGQRIALTHSFFESPAVLRIRMLNRLPNMRRALGKYLPGVPLIILLILFYRAMPEPSSLGQDSREEIVLDSIEGKEPLSPEVLDRVENYSEEPDANAFITVDQEPQPLNMYEVRRAVGYPLIARDAGIEGNVVVRVLVDEEGKYVRHLVLNGVHPVLEKSVTAQLHQLTFSPAMLGGEPVKFWVNIPFAFRLIQ